LAYARQAFEEQLQKVTVRQAAASEHLARTKIQQAWEVLYQDVELGHRVSTIEQVTKHVEEAMQLCAASGLQRGEKQLHQGLDGLRQAWRDIAAAQLRSALGSRDERRLEVAITEARAAFDGAGDHEAASLMEEASSILHNQEQMAIVCADLQKAINTENIKSLRVMTETAKHHDELHELMHQAEVILSAKASMNTARWAILTTRATTEILSYCQDFCGATRLWGAIEQGRASKLPELTLKPALEILSQLDELDVTRARVQRALQSHENDYLTDALNECKKVRQQDNPICKALIRHVLFAIEDIQVY